MVFMVKINQINISIFIQNLNSKIIQLSPYPNPTGLQRYEPTLRNVYMKFRIKHLIVG